MKTKDGIDAENPFNCMKFCKNCRHNLVKLIRLKFFLFSSSVDMLDFFVFYNCIRLPPLIFKQDTYHAKPETLLVFTQGFLYYFYLNVQAVEMWVVNRDFFSC